MVDSFKATSFVYSGVSVVIVVGVEPDVVLEAVVVVEVFLLDPFGDVALADFIVEPFEVEGPFAVVVLAGLTLFAWPTVVFGPLAGDVVGFFASSGTATRAPMRAKIAATIVVRMVVRPMNVTSRDTFERNLDAHWPNRASY
ncbi:MAG: hypothetical protein ACRD1S_04030 [Vicinamibacterales bacterium]